MDGPDACHPPAGGTAAGGGENVDLVERHHDGTRRVVLPASTSNPRGDVGRFVAGRRRVLGRRAVVPLDDPDALAERVAEVLGGRGVALRLLADAVASLDEHPVAERPVVDDLGERIDYAAIYGRVAS